jgi:hypothetical protein
MPRRKDRLEAFSAGIKTLALSTPPALVIILRRRCSTFARIYEAAARWRWGFEKNRFCAIVRKPRFRLGDLITVTESLAWS